MCVCVCVCEFVCARECVWQRKTDGIYHSLMATYQVSPVEGINYKTGNSVKQSFISMLLPDLWHVCQLTGCNEGYLAHAASGNRFGTP